MFASIQPPLCLWYAKFYKFQQKHRKIEESAQMRKMERVRSIGTTPICLCVCSKHTGCACLSVSEQANVCVWLYVTKRRPIQFKRMCVPLLSATSSLCRFRFGSLLMFGVRLTCNCCAGKNLQLSKCKQSHVKLQDAAIETLFQMDRFVFFVGFSRLLLVACFAWFAATAVTASAASFLFNSLFLSLLPFHFAYTIYTLCTRISSPFPYCELESNNKKKEAPPNRSPLRFISDAIFNNKLAFSIAIRQSEKWLRAFRTIKAFRKMLHFFKGRIFALSRIQRT